MKKLRRLATRSLWAFVSLFFTVVIMLAAVYLYMALRLPNVDVLKDAHLQVPLRVFTSDRKLIAQYGVKRRIPVALEQVPEPLKEAVLATEDARFYEHPGVDLIGLARAAKAVLTSGKKVQGASTITMQVARNFFLTRKKTYGRKINEILLAIKVDRELSKDKIFELYLNKIYFGNRAYGVAAAAQVYYGKTLDQLTLPQMAMIAGLPQAPSRNNPIKNPASAKIRRDHVLERMFELHLIQKESYDKAVAAPITASYHVQKIALHAPYLAEMVRAAMVDEYGDAAYDKGLSVYTTVSSTLQKMASQALHDGLLAYDKRHGYRKPKTNLGVYDPDKWLDTLGKSPTVSGLLPAAVVKLEEQRVQALMADGTTIAIPWSGLSWARPVSGEGYLGRMPKVASDIVRKGDLIYVARLGKSSWRLAQVPEVQGAIVSIDPEDGALLALSGGFDYGLSHFNRAVQAKRQTGSDFKPFIYSAALSRGFTLATVINDAPVVIQDSGENTLWRPMNDTRKFYGPTPLRIGLIKSRNLVSIRLLQSIGIPYARSYIERFGFEADSLPTTLSLALGTGLVTPLQLASGYAVFANGGYRVQPYFIQQINDQNDHVLYEADPVTACELCIVNPDLVPEDVPQPAAPRVIAAQNAYLMTRAMQDVIQFGTGRAARVLRRKDLAGKTGTTNKKMDAWFSGFNSHVVTTVWVGFDDVKSLREYGSQSALPIWIQFMRGALRGMPEATMPEPPNMVTARIDPKTGLLARPGQKPSRFELFREGHVPTTFSIESEVSDEQQTSDFGASSEAHLF